jgi:hypothetical protein
MVGGPNHEQRSRLGPVECYAAADFLLALGVATAIGMLENALRSFRATRVHPFLMASCFSALNADKLALLVTSGDP